MTACESYHPLSEENMRRQLPRSALVLALALLLTALAASGAAGQSGRTVTVTFAGRTYTPAVVLISAGDTVTWTGSGTTFTAHPLVSDDGLWPVQNTGTTFSYTFNQPGVYRYYCSLHGAAGGIGMSGKVIVVSGPLHFVSLPFVGR
jgi:plastocyanin